LWYRPGVARATGIWGDEEETGGDPVWRPESNTGCGGNERMKRRRGDSTRFVSMTPSNDESNPATQHAGGVGADRKDGEGRHAALRMILIQMQRMWAGKV
jgi:hypothetical protein